MKPVRLAVVGGGVMGTHHARVALRTPGVELVGLVEQDACRRRDLQSTIPEARYASVDELIEGVDFEAAVVATPTPTHATIASRLLRAGRHVLVEKPITATVAEGRCLAALAEECGLVLTVGHVERFNGAFIEMLRFIDRPIHVDITRSGPFTNRILDNVVSDLMIHDLDLLNVIDGSPLVAARSVLRSTRTTGPDLAVALLSFASGLTASVTASHVSQQKIRLIEVTQEDSVVSADLIRQEVLVHRLQQIEFVNDGVPRTRSSGTIETPFIEHRGEPLMHELQAFAQAVRGGPTVVKPTEALEALRVVEAVLAGGKLTA